MTKYTCPIPCQMLGHTPLIPCQQMEHYIFPAIPINIWHRNITDKYTHSSQPKRIPDIYVYIYTAPECHHLHQIFHV